MTSSTQEPDLASENDVIKERWKIIKKLGGGGFGEIYECLDLVIKDTVAIKLESAKLPKQVLRMEVSVLKKLQGTKHTCKCYGYGRNDKFSYVAMSVQGKNLADLRRQMKTGCFSISTTIQITIQILDAIEDIHKIGFLHRDIKPSNFTIGCRPSTCRIVYMLDFGLARQYLMSDGSLEIRPPRDVAGFRGTVRYASINAHKNIEMGRHDDLWSTFYMIVEMITGQLPWRRMKEKEVVGKAKDDYNHNEFLQWLPGEFKPFLRHIQELDYFKEPDYELLKNLMKECAQHRNISLSDPYDWELSAISADTSSVAPSLEEKNINKRNSVVMSTGKSYRKHQTKNSHVNNTDEDIDAQRLAEISRNKFGADNNDNANSIGKSSHHHNLSNVNAKSEKTHTQRSSMPPVSPRSVISTKERLLEIKFMDDADTPRHAGRSEVTSNDKPASVVVSMSRHSNRRNRRDLEPPLKATNLPILVKPDPSAEDDRDSRKNVDVCPENKPQLNLGKVLGNLPPKPLTMTSGNPTKPVDKNIKSNPIGRANFLFSVGGSIATNAVNDEQFDGSNAPDATKAFHLTQMSNQDADDDDFGYENLSDNDLYEVNNPPIVECVPEKLVPAIEYQKRRSLSGDNISNSGIMKCSKHKPQTQISDRGKSNGRLHGQEEDSSNCKSKESHELEQTLSKAGTTPTSGYVSSGRLSNGSKYESQQKQIVDVVTVDKEHCVKGVVDTTSCSASVNIASLKYNDSRRSNSTVIRLPPKGLDSLCRQHSSNVDSSDLSVSRSSRRNLSSNPSSYGKSALSVPLKPTGVNKLMLSDMKRMSNSNYGNHHSFKNLNDVERPVVMTQGNYNTISHHHSRRDRVGKVVTREHTSAPGHQDLERPVPRPRSHYRSHHHLDREDGGAGDKIKGHRSSGDFIEVFNEKFDIRHRSSSRESIDRRPCSGNPRPVIGKHSNRRHNDQVDEHVRYGETNNNSLTRHSKSDFHLSFVDGKDIGLCEKHQHSHHRTGTPTRASLTRNLTSPSHHHGNDASVHRSFTSSVNRSQSADLRNHLIRVKSKSSNRQHVPSSSSSSAVHRHAYKQVTHDSSVNCDPPISNVATSTQRSASYKPRPPSVTDRNTSTAGSSRHRHYRTSSTSTNRPVNS